MFILLRSSAHCLYFSANLVRFWSKHFYCPFEFCNLTFPPFPVEIGRGRITGVFHVGPCRWCFMLFFTLECVHLRLDATMYTFLILSVVVSMFDILLVVFLMLNVLMWVVCVVKHVWMARHEIFWKYFHMFW